MRYCNVTLSFIFSLLWLIECSIQHLNIYLQVFDFSNKYIYNTSQFIYENTYSMFNNRVCSFRMFVKYMNVILWSEHYRMSFYSLLVRYSEHTISSMLRIIIEYVFLLIKYLERQCFKEPVQIDVLSNTSECLFYSIGIVF